MRTTLEWEGDLYELLKAASVGSCLDCELEGSLQCPGYNPVTGVYKPGVCEGLILRKLDPLYEALKRAEGLP